VSGQPKTDAEYGIGRGAERVGRDVNLGIEGSKSNGHGKEMDREGNMMKLIERL
jgi:hypothetical protein